MSLPCVILAGGLGTRMLPATERVPKTLLPVLGRPFADLQLEWLRSQGVQQVIYSIGHLGDAIREHCGDGTKYGLTIDYVDEGGQLRGTGGAVRLVVDSGLLGVDAFFVLNGDSYLDVDLGAVARAFDESQLPALMTVLHNRDRWDRSNVDFRHGRVMLYDKRRSRDDARSLEWIDYGLAIVRVTVIESHVPAGLVADLADLMHELSIAGQLGGFEVTDRFFEIGSPEGLRALESRLSTRGQSQRHGASHMESR